MIIGRWPAEPGLAERSNLSDLATVAGQPLAGRLPEGSGRLRGGAFLGAARRSLAPALGGMFVPDAG